MHNQDKTVANRDTLALEVRDIVHLAAEPWRAGDSVKAGISRAARRLGLSFRRARTF